MSSRLVPRVILFAVLGVPFAALADDAANDAALHSALSKALDASIQSDVKTKVATSSSKLPSNGPTTAKSERVQPLREPPADVAVLEVRPDSGYCLANPSQDDGC